MQYPETFFRMIFLLLPVFLTITVAVNAQEAPQPGAEQVGDKEFKVFVEALQEVQGIQADMDTEISDVVGRSDLTEDRFFEIYRVAQGTSADIPPEEVNEQELKLYQETLAEIFDVQQSHQREMVEAVQENGLEVNRFNEILMLVRTDEELMERLKSCLN